jgi:hypothetical protein
VETPAIRALRPLLQTLHKLQTQALAANPESNGFVLLSNVGSVGLVRAKLPAMCEVGFSDFFCR